VLGACADRLPQLRHISVGCELDALLRARGGNVLDALSELTQLTSLALTDYQPAHRESPAHEGYSIVPHLLGSLPRLHSADLRICSGQDAHLEAAAAVPDVRLVLTLARHEQTPFNRHVGRQAQRPLMHAATHTAQVAMAQRPCAIYLSTLRHTPPPPPIKNHSTQICMPASITHTHTHHAVDPPGCHPRSLRSAG
jgi:imidazoleglycerol phosphate dehydratase HisB